MNYLPELKRIGLCPIKKIIFLLLFSFASWASPITSFDPSKVTWKIHKTDGTSKVYQATKAMPSGLVPLKADTTFDHPLERVYSVLSDYNRRVEWVPRLEESYTLPKNDMSQYIAYTRYDSPFPFQDRSALVNVVDRYSSQKQTVVSTIVSIEHPKVPHKKGEVRLETKGLFLLKAIDGGKRTYGEVILVNDFKGNIPIWVINFVQKSWPLKMFKSLKVQLKKEDIKVQSGLLKQLVTLNCSALYTPLWSCSG